MEDDNRLDLSLGPPSTGKTATATGKSVGVNDRDTKLINEFKHFLDGGTMQIGPGMPSSQMKPENFYGNSSSTQVDLETSKDFNVGGFWITKDRHTDGNEENRPDVREKRKNVFGETSQQKKHEKGTDHSDMPDKSRASHISINTDDDSTADNEDVADSEANFHGIYHPNAVELHGTKRYNTVSSEKDFKIENVSQSGQFSNQPVNIMSMNQLNSVGMNIRPSYPVYGVKQVGASTSNERTTSQLVLGSNLPVLVGYNPVSLPKLDNENSRVLGSHHQLINQSGVSRGQLNSDKFNDGTPNPSETRHDTSGIIKQPIEGDRAEDTSRTNFAMDQPRADGFTSEYPTIKPGIAADVKFGGCGSYPNLPWVSTTGTGPNGRTISGVTYRYNPTHIRIVCACHGTHLSPEEFVQHASEEQATQVGNVPSSNPDTLTRG